MRLADKVAIVTGAARGIGQGFALRLLREGAKVVVADKLGLDDTVKKANAGANITPVRVDVVDARSTASLAAKAFETYGRIDVLVNNAAFLAKLKTFDNIPEEEWDLIFDVNVKGTWNCCKAVYPFMKQGGGGSIINISSATILEGAPLILHYVATKGAVWSLTRSLAREIGQYGIRVNSITPGYTMTKAAIELSDDTELMDYIARKSIESRIVQRAMMPKDLEGALVFLASNESEFMSGQNLNVDGGLIHY